jgi:hypothetical protein
MACHEIFRNFEKKDTEKLNQSNELRIEENGKIKSA